MLGELFSMHNIKYIISVDDCYAEPDESELRMQVCKDMINSLTPVSEYLATIGKQEKLEEIEFLNDREINSSPLIDELVNSLKLDEVKKCHIFFHSEEQIYYDEQKGIQTFLNNLKSKSIITDYRTIASVQDANDLNLEKENFTDGSILWLIDRNFNKVCESEDAGLELAKNIISKKDGKLINYIYILTSVNFQESDDENEIEKQIDKLLSSTEPDIASFIYYIDKTRVIKNMTDRIAKSIAHGFKRKVCFELFNIFAECLIQGTEKAKQEIYQIKQDVLDYMFSEKVKQKGESHFDFIARLVQIFNEEQYNFFLSKKNLDIYKKIEYYQSINKIVNGTTGNVQKMIPIITEFRRLELFNKYINKRHCEVAPGDIFKIGDDYYLLSTQSCDTYIRTNGKRKLRDAMLLRIVDNFQGEFCFELPCFYDCTNELIIYDKPRVVYQKNLTIPFDILDLCVVDKQGIAKVRIEDLGKDNVLDSQYTDNFNERYNKILRKLGQVYENKVLLDKYIDAPTDIKKKDAKEAYANLLNLHPIIKKYTNSDDGYIIYPIQRICRLNELTVVDILNQYGNILSRVGQPFDFAQ